MGPRGMGRMMRGTFEGYQLKAQELSSSCNESKKEEEAFEGWDGWCEEHSRASPLLSVSPLLPVVCRPRATYTGVTRVQVPQDKVHNQN